MTEDDDPMISPAELVPWTRAAVVAVFALVALLAVRRAPREGRAGWWVAAAFGSVAVTLLVSGLRDMGVAFPAWSDGVQLVLVLVFPYLLLRFTASFQELPAWLEFTAAGAGIAVVAATFIVPPGAGASLPSAYVTGALAYWVGVSLVTVLRLWTAGRGQPTTSRRRMRLMSAATAVAALALLVSAVSERSAGTHLAVQLTALISAVGFALGFSPPPALRLSWRRPEEEELHRGMMAVLRATTVEEVTGELLWPTARLVGAKGAALVDASGQVTVSCGEAPDAGTSVGPGGSTTRHGTSRSVVSLGEAGGDLVVWTSPYTSFFGREERHLLRTMAAVASLALERCALLEEERAQRAAMEQAREEAEAARQEAMRANAAKTGFLSRMSHELRTPLNAILGFGQMLELSASDPDDEQAVHYILKAGRHLLALIEDILDLSRIEAGTLTISLEPVDTRELIEDVAGLIRPLASTRSIQLRVDTADCDGWVLTDRQRCRQILLNLLSNAVKYNYDGGRIDVRALPGEGTLRVSVRDRGPGIDAARQEQLFEPFERLGAESSGVEGTGLGLALAKQLVERLGGSIGVETAPGQGSTFWIDLPLTDTPTSPGDAAAPRPQPAMAGARTLLLVEDNLANLRVVEAMLRQRPGVSVLPAMQGSLAVDLAREHRPDVIVLDLHLPDLPGREVLHRLQSDPRTRHIPVVIASADATPRRMRQLQAEGAFDYLTKPLDMARFLDVVDAAVARCDRRRAGADGAHAGDETR